MPELNTEHVTHHVVRLTATELESLREAARIALDTIDGPCVHTTDWQALRRLGLGPTRKAHDLNTLAINGLDEALPRRSEA
ncbi:hypothetical protein [Streptomyces sp. NBC_01506]|uniref:hypothetical protein n=1 Tax=Streptomyces sp. NBC_01506 TaxID=2903887 RepID=UPI003867899C